MSGARVAGARPTLPTNRLERHPTRPSPAHRARAEVLEVRRPLLLKSINYNHNYINSYYYNTTTNSYYDYLKYSRLGVQSSRPSRFEGQW